MQQYTFKFKALGGSNCIQFYAEGASDADRISREVIEDINCVENKYSRYLPESIVSKINLNAGMEQPVQVDEETAALLDYAQMCYEQSEGLFDITSGVLRNIWNFSQPTLPSQEQIDQILELVGWNKAEWKKPCFRLTKPGMQLDFGGFGKEYAADRAANLFSKLGVINGFVNLGGDVRVLGPHPDGKPWLIGIAHPRKKESAITSIAIKIGAIASSGDYERFFEKDGKRYCHILNALTGWPVQDMQAVSVLSESCLVAGSAATIAMLFGESKGRQFLKELQLKNIVINSKGEVQWS